MLVYSVRWCSDSSLTKGKGRVLKQEGLIGFTVLCRNSKDAVSCFEWFFRHQYKNSANLDPADGTLSLTRCKLDSRNFHIDYLQADGIKTPVCLHDLKASLSPLTCNIF